MSKTASIILTIVLSLVLGFAGGYLAQQINQEESEDLSGLKNRVSSLQASLTDVQNKVNNIDTGGGGESADLSSLENSLSTVRSQISDLEGRVEQVSGQISGQSQETSGTKLEIGYMNAQRAFQVFTDAVGGEREEVKNIQSDIQDLIKQFSADEIDREDFRLRYDTLRAKRLQAQLQVDLAMINKMQEARGFTDIRQDLQNVKQQINPLQNNIDTLVDDLEMGFIDPEKAEGNLGQLDSQFQQLDQMMTGIIESKMSQVAYGLAGEEDYDLVFRQENVLLYRNSESVDDLTEQVMDQLREELKAENA